MSNNINEDALPPPAKKSAVPTTRKTAAKKIATKTASKKVANKKTTARKAESSVVKAVPQTVEAQPLKIPRAKKTVRVPTVEITEAEKTPPAAKKTTRVFGRVPGGGPTSTRENSATESPAHTPDIPLQAAFVPQAPLPQQPETRSSPAQESPAQEPQNRQNPPSESRSKRRREKRKRRNNERGERTEQGGQPQKNRQGGQQGNSQGNYKNQQRQRHEPNNDFDDRRPTLLDGPKIEANGMLELAPKGFGFLRVPQKNFEQARDDVFVSPELIRKFNLRLGQWIHGLYQEGLRGPQLVEITSINDLSPEASAKLPHFDELKAINPTRRISFETTPERFTTRVIDIMAPVGRGQRGLIVSPPRSGKTTLLLHMAEAIREKYDEAIHLMVVLVDERPEEVTEFRRALPGTEIYASSNDEQARNHCRIAELAIERAKRLVEAGKDVFLLMDSITRLARAYNGNMNQRGRGTGSGGITIGALEIPRRLFAAARNTRGGGSLTILATALIQTNSRADEAIFMEFKGTGNMELVLDRKIAENYIYPAVDIFKSGTRREELLLADHMLHKIHLIRRGLAGHRPAEAMERLLFFLKKFPNNPQMLMEIKG